MGEMCYHVINRGNGRSEVFHKEIDYLRFIEMMRQFWLTGFRPVGLNSYELLDRRIICNIQDENF